ncbi:MULTISPECIES: hypothetical protein [Eikenella]|uniref:hypothetical protein n=1 Tax=Eikenella TaxID=538 RepID=UPI000AE5A3F7|nr:MULTISPECIES: hypothetical protein [Eikenella]
MKFKSGQGDEAADSTGVRQGEATPYWFLLIHYRRLPEKEYICFQVAFRLFRLPEKIGLAENDGFKGANRAFAG